MPDVMKNASRCLGSRMMTPTLLLNEGAIVELQFSRVIELSG
jgi:hypothetical protein